MKQVKVQTLTTLEQIAEKAKFLPSGGGTITEGSEDEFWQEMAKFLDSHPSVIIMQEAMDIPQSVSTVLREPRRGRYYVLPEPNPVSLFLNDSIESYNLSSDKHKELRAIPISNFHWQFHSFCNFFRKKSNAIIMLTTALESFLNQMIPDEGTIMFEQANKTKEELEWIPTKDKLRKFPIEFSSTSFHLSNKTEFSDIINLVTLRNDLIHLKPFDIPNKTRYKNLNDDIIKFDYERHFESTKTFFNEIKPNFVEYQEE